jgi:hypothetical protein
MAWPVSLATLEQDILLKADMAGSAFPQPGEVCRYANQGVTELYELLMTSGQDYLLASATVTTANTVDTYPLPFAFMAVKGIDINLGGQQQFDGTRANWSERNLYKLIGTGWYFGRPVRYDLRGSNLWVQPVPQGAYTITVWYWPTAPQLASPAQTIDCVNGWEEVISLSGAEKLARREESFDLADRLHAMLLEAKQRVKNMAPKRNYGEPTRVTQVNRGARRGGWRRGLA